MNKHEKRFLFLLLASVVIANNVGNHTNPEVGFIEGFVLIFVLIGALYSLINYSIEDDT